jgi:hypothetical protein
VKHSESDEDSEESVDVGMMMVFASYGWENTGDHQVWDEEISEAEIVRQGSIAGIKELAHPRDRARGRVRRNQ